MSRLMTDNETSFFRGLVHTLFGFALPSAVARQNDVVTLSACAGSSADRHARERLVRYYRDVVGFETCIPQPDVAYLVDALEKCDVHTVGMRATVGRLRCFHKRNARHDVCVVPSRSW